MPIRKRKHSTLPDARGLSSTPAAAYLGCSTSSLNHSRLTGELLGVPAPPFVRAGRTVLYLRDDPDTWLESLPRHRHVADEAAGKRR